MTTLKSAILAIFYLVCTTVVLKAQAGNENNFNVKGSPEHFNGNIKVKAKIEQKDGHKLLITESTSDSGTTKRMEALLHNDGNSGTIVTGDSSTRSVAYTTTPFYVLTHRLLSELADRESSTRYTLAHQYFMLPTGFISDDTHMNRGMMRSLEVERNDGNSNLFTITGELTVDITNGDRNSAAPDFAPTKTHIQITPDDILERFALRTLPPSTLGISITLSDGTDQTLQDEQNTLGMLDDESSSDDEVDGSNVEECNCGNSRSAQAQ